MTDLEKRDARKAAELICQDNKERYLKDAGWYVKKPILIRAVQMNEPFMVRTLEGVLRGTPGDYLVEGTQGELYPVKKEIFESTYAPSLIDRMTYECSRVEGGGGKMTDYVIWRCNRCGYEFAVSPELDEPRFCPYCGKALKEANDERRNPDKENQVFLLQS